MASRWLMILAGYASRHFAADTFDFHAIREPPRRFRIFFSAGAAAR
jgi:hypothetical protein